MDARRQLMVRRMAEVVVTGYAAGVVKPAQVFPLLDRIKGRYGSELEGRDLPLDFYSSLVRLKRETSEPDTNSVRIVAYGRMLDMLARANVKLTSDARYNLELLSVALANHPTVFPMAKSDTLKWLLGDPQGSDPPGVLASLGFKVGTSEYNRACGHLARIREDQGVVDKRTVILYLDSLGVAGSYGDSASYFDAAARGTLAFRGDKHLDSDVITTLIRYAIRLDDLVSAEQLAYKLVSMETKP